MGMSGRLRALFAKLNHLAIVSENYILSGKFYEAVFGMTIASHGRAANAVVVGDGYLGLNSNPRVAGARTVSIIRDRGGGRGTDFERMPPCAAEH
jgi:hypothetical protein